MSRIRNDQVCLSIGRENVAILRAEAAKEGLPVSALVRNGSVPWPTSEDENGSE